MPLTYEELIKKNKGKGLFNEQREELTKFAKVFKELSENCKEVSLPKFSDYNDPDPFVDDEYELETETIDLPYQLSSLSEFIETILNLDMASDNEFFKTYDPQKGLDDIDSISDEDYEHIKNKTSYEMNVRLLGNLFGELKEKAVLDSLMKTNKEIGEKSGAYPLGKDGEKLAEFYSLINETFQENYNYDELGKEDINKKYKEEKERFDWFKPLSDKKFTKDDQELIHAYGKCVSDVCFGLIINNTEGVNGIKEKADPINLSSSFLYPIPDSGDDKDGLDTYRERVNTNVTFLQALTDKETFKAVMDTGKEGKPVFGTDNETLYKFIDLMNNTYGAGIDKEKIIQLDQEYQKEKTEQAQREAEREKNLKEKGIYFEAESVQDIKIGEYKNKQEMHTKIFEAAKGLDAKHRTGIGTSSAELQKVKTAYQNYTHFIQNPDQHIKDEKTEKDYLEELKKNAEEYIRLKKKNGWGDTSSPDWRPNTKMGKARYEANLKMLELANERLAQISSAEMMGKELADKKSADKNKEKDIEQAEKLPENIKRRNSVKNPTIPDMEQLDNEALNVPAAGDNGAKLDIQKKLSEAQEQIRQLGDNVTAENLELPLSQIITCQKIVSLKNNGKPADISQEQFDQVNKSKTIDDPNFKEMINRTPPKELASQATKEKGQNLYSNYRLTADKVKEEVQNKVGRSHTFSKKSTLSIDNMKK